MRFLTGSLFKFFVTNFIYCSFWLFWLPTLFHFLAVHSFHRVCGTVGARYPSRIARAIRDLPDWQSAAFFSFLDDVVVCRRCRLSGVSAMPGLGAQNFSASLSWNSFNWRRRKSEMYLYLPAYLIYSTVNTNENTDMRMSSILLCAWLQLCNRQSLPSHLMLWFFF